MSLKRSLVVAVVLALFVSPLFAQTTMPRSEWGAMDVKIIRPQRKSDDQSDQTAGRSGTWTIQGQKNKVTIDQSNLALTIDAGGTKWAMVPSGPRDIQVRMGSDEFYLSLADAGRMDITPYDAGFKTGVKITLGEWKHEGQTLNLTLYLVVALEGKDEDLVFDIGADESGGAVVHQLDWPTALDSGDIDYTVLSNMRGMMLPRNWPLPYFPIRATNPDHTAKPLDTSEVQSNIIESWSMSWWGFQKAKSAMMVIVETPDDGAYQFNHPAGGPTVIGPRWRNSLGKLGYPRTCRMVFFPNGNYVDMAKRYRSYIIDKGQFVSLADKIYKRPIVKELIGTPIIRLNVLTNIVRDSLRYNTTQPDRNHSLVTFDDRAKQLTDWKKNGLDKLQVCLTGWTHEGYDRQHPDELPPSDDAGGWEGMKRLADTCKSLGYLFSLHDQYRDYYLDAPSFDRQFAVQEEDALHAPIGFPGSRFGQWKEGRIDFMNNWDGGVQTYLNNRYMLGHMEKNYIALADHGIHPQGIYLDVFGYIPPDEDFNPEHLTSRSDAIAARIACYNWAKNHIGFIGTEAGCDWTSPYTDFTSPLESNRGISLPLFNLVYHDSVITPYDPKDLHGFLNGGLPQIFGRQDTEMRVTDNMRRMAALHERVALLEMTKHEFLDDKMIQERTTFSDGTTVTVDWDKKTATIVPDVDVK